MIATVYQVTAASTNFTLVQCDDIDRYLQVEAKRARAAPFYQYFYPWSSSSHVYGICQFRKDMRFLGRTRHQNRFYQRRGLEVVLVPILISSPFEDVPQALVEETDTEDKEDRSTMG